MINPPSPDIAVLWAKSNPRHPLWKHLVDAAAVSLSLPLQHVHLNWDPRITALIVGLHDIGKADCEFQFRAFQEELRETGYSTVPLQSCRHERLSGAFVEARLSEAGVPICLADAISRALYAHHGELTKDHPRPVLQRFVSAQHTLFTLLLQILGIDGFTGISSDNLSSVGMVLSGHIVLCDWIASNEGFYLDHRLRGISDPEEYFHLARTVAEQWIHDLGFREPLSPGNPVHVVSVPRPLQKALLENDIAPGLVIIEAPMGEGKTEAAWILAEKWKDSGINGMYMALPTMATSDAIFVRYRSDYLHRIDPAANVRLVHGMAWLRDQAEELAPSEIGEGKDEKDLAALWFRPTRRAMLTAHGVGTVDQAMLAGMYVKFGFLRLYGLLHRVLIIDEVHAYDAYMTAIISRLLQWCACLRIPVILLSATLFTEQRASLLRAYGASMSEDEAPALPYPLVTTVNFDGGTKSISSSASSTRDLKIELHEDALEDPDIAARLAQHLTELGGNCCVIVNTVLQAQRVYEAIDVPEEEKMLFHARFTAEDRIRLAQRVTTAYGKDISQRPHRSILVATQVVEQSLDVDFDFMISEIAPIDLLLQRSGRMHRHRQRDVSPELHVLLPRIVPQDGRFDFRGTGYVYSEKPLLRTMALLSTNARIQLPMDFRYLIEHCYGKDTWEQSIVPWEMIHMADAQWEKEYNELFQQGYVYSLLKPCKDAFFPVDNTPVGEDSDDGRGWRACTRLGATDRSVAFLTVEEMAALSTSEPTMLEVLSLHRRSLKIPGYINPFNPAPGNQCGLEGKKRLSGLTLIPLNGDGRWSCFDRYQHIHEFIYHPLLGLTRRRVGNE